MLKYLSSYKYLIEKISTDKYVPLSIVWGEEISVHQYFIIRGNKQNLVEIGVNPYNGRICSLVLIDYKNILHLDGEYIINNINSEESSLVFDMKNVDGFKQLTNSELDQEEIVIEQTIPIYDMNEFSLKYIDFFNNFEVFIYSNALVIIFENYSENVFFIKNDKTIFGFDKNTKELCLFSVVSKEEIDKIKSSLL